LPCLLGSWAQRGGGLLLSSSGWASSYVCSDRLERPDLLGGRRVRAINMSTIGDALLHEGAQGFGPRIQALVVYNSNPVAVAPESPKVVQGFLREDLFTVVLEQFKTDTVDYADIVLPATTQLEHLDVHKAYGHTDLMFNEPSVEPLGQARPNTRIFAGLAKAMGYTDACFDDSDETMAREAFDWQALGTTFEALRAKGWVALPIPALPFAQGGFHTPDGKAQANGADFIPNLESALNDPVLAKRYPLAMISPPARHFLNSTFVNVQSLRSIEGEPLVEIHADDADQRGILSGDMVRLFNDRGEYRCKAEVSERARPGVVNALGVWWRKLGPSGTNVNEVTAQHVTDLGEGATFYDCLVDVARVTGKSPTAVAML
jgi:anaerobic selenocysteine-containing dehydrogenase